MKTFLLFFALSIGGVAQATTYFISPFGNDATGNGSSVNPWKTLSKATSTVTSPGDIIFVTAGNYLETQVCNLAVGVSINGTGVTSVIQSTISTQWTAMINASSGSEGTNGNQSVSNIKLDGRGITEWGLFMSCRSNFIMFNCTIVDFKDRGVFWAGVASTGQTWEPAIYATGNKFYNNTLVNCGGYGAGYGRGELNIGGQDGMLIYNNTFILDRPSGQNGYCIKYVNDGWLRGIKIYNNTFNKTPIAAIMGNNDWPFAIEFAHTTGGVEIYNNSFTGAGIDANVQYRRDYAYSMWIHHNTIKNISPNAFRQAGVILEFSTEGIIIENNTMENLAYGVMFTPRSITENAWSGNIRNITIQKNLMLLTQAESGGNFIFFYGDGGAQFQYNYDSIQIYNNTMMWKPGYEHQWGIGLPFSATGGHIRDIGIKNNIMANATSGSIVQCGPCGPNVIPDRVSIMNNNTYNCGNANQPVWLGATPTNYSYGNNVSIVPVYGPDYTLLPGSPLIDVGVQVGLPYSGSAPDKGYFEYGLTLPIKLTDFTVKENAGKHVLQWNTSSESNSSHFSIERSSNGVYFSSIGRVNAGGFSTTEKIYNFSDGNPLPGINYYRLKMIDLDASFEYSKIVSIKNKTADESFSIGRLNLSTGSNTATLVIRSKKTQTANLSILDASGRTFYNAPISLQVGDNTITKNLPLLSKGVYYVKVFTPEVTVVKNTFTQN